MTFKSVVNGAVRAAKTVVNQGCEWANKAREFVADNSRKVAVAIGLGGAAMMETTARADSSAPDASASVTTAQTTFDAVGALVAAAVGFFIIVKIVKWIRK